MMEFSCLTVNIVNIVKYLPCAPVSAQGRVPVFHKASVTYPPPDYLLAPEVTQSTGILETNPDENLYFHLAL